MLDMQVIRETPDVVRHSMQVRQMDPAPVDQVLELDAERRTLLGEVEQLKAERNAVSKELGRSKDAAGRQEKIEDVACDQLVTIQEGAGIVRKERFSAARP
jgi:seryl-tRNA synthetase